MCIGNVCKIHPTRNGHACTNQRNGIWLRGPRDRSRVRRADAHSHNVRVINPHYIDHSSLNYFYSGPDEGQVARAKVLTEDLLEVVRSEHAKMALVVQQQQMELHQAQMQYAAYSGYAPPAPTSAPPPPPPGEQPPPPPDGSAPPPPPGAGQTTGAEADAYAAYWYFFLSTYTGPIPIHLTSGHNMATM